MTLRLRGFFFAKSVLVHFAKNCMISHELRDQMQFEVDYAKLHHIRVMQQSTFNMPSLLFILTQPHVVVHTRDINMKSPLPDNSLAH